MVGEVAGPQSGSDCLKGRKRARFWAYLTPDLVNPKAQRLSRNPVLLEGRDQQGLLSDQGWLKGF